MEMTYHERAFLYDQEIAEDMQIPVFIEKLKKSLKITSCIIIPCGSGQYIDFFEHSFDKAIFLDNDANMVKLVKQKIDSRKLKHITADIADLRYSTHFTADIVFVFNQALQFIPSNQLDNFLNNMQSCKYIVLDLYNFSGISDDRLSYYDIKKDDGLYYPTRDFFYKGQKIVRYTMSQKRRNGVEITYKYVSTKGRFFCKIFMYYYNLMDTIKQITSNGKYLVNNVYGDYQNSQYTGQNRFILLLERRKDASL